MKWKIDLINAYLYFTDQLLFEEILQDCAFYATYPEVSLVHLKSVCVCVGERGIKYEYPRLMDQIFSCIPTIPSSTSKHYILFVSDLLYIKWLVHLAITDFIEKTALVVMAQNSCSIHFVLKTLHCGWCLWMNAWAQTHFTHES